MIAGPQAAGGPLSVLDPSMWSSQVMQGGVGGDTGGQSDPWTSYSLNPALTQAGWGMSQNPDGTYRVAQQTSGAGGTAYTYQKQPDGSLALVPNSGQAYQSNDRGLLANLGPGIAMLAAGGLASGLVGAGMGAAGMGGEAAGFGGLAAGEGSMGLAGSAGMIGGDAALAGMPGSLGALGSGVSGVGGSAAFGGGDAALGASLFPTTSLAGAGDLAAAGAALPGAELTGMGAAGVGGALASGFPGTVG